VEYADILNSRRPKKYRNKGEGSLDIFTMDTKRLIRTILERYLVNEMEIEERR